MKIVIDIPDTLYETIKSDKYGVHQGRIYDIIKNGTQLPKGHGRLIDVNDIEGAKQREERGCIFYDTIDWNDIENAPTIVEADKAGEDV